MFEYGILFVLLLLSFYFSGTETAVTAVSTPMLYDLSKKGDWRAQKVIALKKDSSKLLGTLLFGNNVVNIALTALSTALMIEIFGEKYGVLVATFGVSFAVLLFSEILPKTYALNNSLSFSRISAPFLGVFVICFSPIVKGFNFLSQLLIKFLPQTDLKINSVDSVKAEIRGTLLLPSNDVAIRQEKGMLKSVLELGDVTIEDIMVHRSHLVSLNVNMSLPEIFEFLSRSPYSRIPLWKGEPDNVIGILHAKALLKLMNAYYRGKVKVSVSDYLTKPWFVLNTTTLLDQLHAFKKRREHFALVVDEYGSIEGLVTLEDILEEIVGDISDENDMPDQSDLQVVKTEAGGFRVDGQATIRDINRYFKWELSDEHAATLAGYILFEVERIPNIGETFVIDGFSFTIVQKDKNRLSLVEILPPAS